MKKAVTYTDFGAKGDGITDDFAAICAAHAFANANALPVVINDGKSYLIRETLVDGEVRSAVIQTDVHWGNARLVIDDSEICDLDGTPRATSPIFRVLPSTAPFDLTDPTLLAKFAGIGEGTTALPLALGYPALLVIYNEDHRVYRRYGASYQGQAAPQNEIILIDASGNVDPSTPFMFRYDHVTKITVIRADERPLTLKGGSFITHASQKNAIDPTTQRRARYIQRNLLIQRSNVALDGVSHYVENELPLSYYKEKQQQGAHYWGFFHATYAHNVLLQNCVLTARRSYRFSTYEFIADHVNRIRLVGCRQSNFKLRDEQGNEVFSMSPSPITRWPHCWGIGGSNFCKNMEYADCTLSRFDAHQGLYNGRIANSTINFMEVVGKGELTLENVTWYSAAPGAIYNSLVYLREDFGSTWDGQITLKSCTFYPCEGDVNVFHFTYTNWDYGYRCHFPNLVIEDPAFVGLTPGAKVHLVNEKTSVEREPQLHLPHTKCVAPKTPAGEEPTHTTLNLNPITPPKRIHIWQSGATPPFYLPKCDFFAETEKLGVTEYQMQKERKE